MKVTASNSPLCGVRGCDSFARYECPRCALRYCSTSCYAAHSNLCVEAFTAEVSKPWQGRKVSEYERRKFHQIARRIREAGFASGEGYEEEIYAAEAEGGEEDAEEAMEELERRGDGDADGEDEDKDEDDARLLERFMEGLDHEQREMVFGLLDEGMCEVKEVRNGENIEGNTDEKAGYDSEPRESSEYCANEALSEKSNVKGERNGEAGERERKKNVSSGGGLTDRLEQLTNDIEAFDLSYEQIMARLPQELVREFEKRLRDGRAARLIVLWKPWWIVGRTGNENNEGFVIEDGAVEEEKMPPLPIAADLRVPIEVPRQRASASVIYNVTEVVVAYCHALRMCNGDWRVQVIDVARRVWETSAVLADDRRYEGVEEVCEACQKMIVVKDQSTDAALEALNDAAAVLSGLSDWVARSLFECQRIFDNAFAQMDGGDSRKHVKARARKIAYFVSWALCQDSESFLKLARKLLSYVDVIVEQREEVRVADKAVRIMKELHRKPGIAVIK